MDEVKRTRSERVKNNQQMGIKADVDFQVLVEQELHKIPLQRPVSRWFPLICIVFFIAHSGRPAEDLSVSQEATHFLERTRSWRDRLRLLQQSDGDRARKQI